MTNYSNDKDDKCFEQLTEAQRHIIQILLVKECSFTYIGDAIGKDRTTVSKEVKRNRHLYSKAFEPYDPVGIKLALENCERLNKKPYVCNSCPDVRYCTKRKLYYNYQTAQNHSDEVKVDSRTGVDITPEEIELISEQIISLIRDQKQSVNQVYANHSDILYFSKTTFYKYMDLGLFPICAIDLPRKVNYKPRHKVKDRTNKRELALLKGRKYEDFIEYSTAHPNMNIVEMDTVIGKRDSSKCLFTMYIKKTHFMFIFLLDKKDAASVNAKINYLKDTLGAKLYSKVFRILLTDNGTEFFSVLNFERDTETNRKLTSLFFCHPYSSYEKHGIEVNHQYIRRVFPKGTSFDDANDDIIKKLQDNINAVPRDSLNGNTPFDLTKELYPELIEKLGFKYIAPDDVTLAPDDIKSLRNK